MKGRPGLARGVRGEEEEAGGEGEEEGWQEEEEQRGRGGEEEEGELGVQGARKEGQGLRHEREGTESSGSLRRRERKAPV